MNQVDYIYRMLQDISVKAPVMLVGEATTIFKKMYSGHIYHLDNTETVKDFITQFSDLEYDKPIVVEDISDLYRDMSLLKLVEDIKLPLILLASRDNISAPLQSRIKTYIKFNAQIKPDRKIVSNDEAIKHLDKENITDMNLIEDYLAESCPELLLWNTKLKSYRYRDRFLKLL